MEKEHFDPDLPLQITIPRPLPTVLSRGKHAAEREHRPKLIHLRVSHTEDRMIHRAMEITGCAHLSEFLRWMIVHGAKVIIREAEKNERKSRPTTKGST